MVRQVKEWMGADLTQLVQFGARSGKDASPVACLPQLSLLWQHEVGQETEVVGRKGDSVFGVRMR